MTTKITDANIDSDKQDNNAFNISLLGFKMAVNEGLTVFNLVDGVVDEFNDETGTDEAEGSNDYYCGTDDVYSNNNTVTCLSAGFSTTAITEPDTSTTGTNPADTSGTMGQYTVPAGISSVNTFVWGAGGGTGGGGDASSFPGQPAESGSGAGGFSTGTLAVTPGQTLYISAGEGGIAGPACTSNAFLNGGDGGGSPNPGKGGGGGGLAGIFSADLVPLSAPQYSAPQATVVAGSGGAHVGRNPTDNSGPGNSPGGAGGGTQGLTGGSNSAQTAPAGGAPGITAMTGGGGDQEQGGTGGNFSQNGSLFTGGNVPTHSTPTRGGAGGGGAGYYGGGGGGYCRGDPLCRQGGGGGGSGYIAHPQITCGSTTAGCYADGGGVSNPNYVAGTNEGINFGIPAPSNGEDGYVLITASTTTFAAPGGGSSTIVSEPFTSTSVPTSSRIVVFEENVDTPTLNTDIVASVSRDGGATFTNATLADSGYVTGSSGQRILTGQADISGQPSGQSMRWKLALANNTVKIHGVSLQWS